MKIIFLKDNPSGKKNQVKEVANGYAQNYLLPQKIAIVATPEKVAALATSSPDSPEEKKVENISSGIKKLLSTLKNLKIEITAKANKEGHLFGGISNEDIQKILQEKYNLDINKDAIELPHHLKELGNHKVKVKVDNQEAELKVIIKSEK